MKKTLSILSFVLLFMLTIGFASAADSDNLTDDSLISVVSDDIDNTQIEQTDNTEYKLNEIKKTENLLSDDGRDTPVVDVNNCTAFEGENVTVRFNVTDSSGALISGDVNVTVSDENRTVSEIIRLNNASGHYSMADLIGLIKANDKSNIQDIYNIINSSFDSTKINTSGLISGFGDIYNGLGVNVFALISSITDIMNSSDVNITRLINGWDKIERSTNISMLVEGLEDIVNLSSIDIPTFSTILHTFMGGFDFNVAGIIDQFRKGISFNKTLMTSGINGINNELGIFKSNNIFDIMNDLGLKLSISNLLKAGNIISKDIIIYWDLVDLFKDILDDNDLTPAEFIERTLKQDKFNLSNIITKISNSDFNRNNIINAVTQIIMATKIDYNLIKSAVKNIETSSFNSSKVINELAGIPEINISDDFDSSKIIRGIYKLINASTLNVSGIVDGSNEAVSSFKFHITESANAINRLKNSFNLNTSMIMNGLDIFAEAMGINVSTAAGQIIEKYGYFIIIPGSFAPGIYNVSVKYLSNDRYDSAVNDNAKLTVVNKNDTSIEAYAVVDKTNVSIECHIPSNASGIVVLEFDDYFSVVPLIKGNFIYKNNFAPGDYDVKVLYFGNRQFNKNDTSVSFTVNNLNLTNTNQTVSPDVIKVPSSDSKNPVFKIDIPGDATGTLKVLDENGKVIAESPVIDGKSNVTVDSLSPGNHTVSVVYSGDDKYDPVNVTATVNIPQDTPKPAVKKVTMFSVKNKVTFKKSKRSKTISIKFTLLSGKSKLSEKNVFFKLDKNALKSIKVMKGKNAKKAKKILKQLKKGTYVVKTKKGVATLKLSKSYFTFKKLKKGKITANFRGDNSYKAANKTITLVMK